RRDPRSRARLRGNRRLERLTLAAVVNAAFRQRQNVPRFLVSRANRQRATSTHNRGRPRRAVGDPSSDHALHHFAPNGSFGQSFTALDLWRLSQCVALQRSPASGSPWLSCPSRRRVRRAKTSTRVTTAGPAAAPAAAGTA